MRALLLCLLASCATADAMTPAPIGTPRVAPNSELGLNPGETMAFEVKIGGVVAGEAQLAVGEIGEANGVRSITVTSRAQTTGAVDAIKHVVDAATTQIDVATGKPLAIDSVAENGDKHSSSHAKFLPTKAEVTFVRAEDPGHPRTYSVRLSGKEPVYDAHSAMAQLRGWRAAPGTTKQVFIVGGRKLWRVDVKLVGYETLGTALGNRKAVHFEGASFKARPDLTLESDKPGRTFQVWLSDDGDRVPLRVSASTELGEIGMELTDYQRP